MQIILIGHASKTWLLLLRLMILAGFGRKSKVYTVAQQRAKEASVYLMNLANTHESIALMGHCGMHWLVGKEMERLGWKCVKQGGGSKNWGYKVYKSP